ncbi:nucleolar protein 12-domain-containing protein [Xylariaceae sp. FL0255]|nr:nucleolar protein 12-domain-containing protein [Xylariaceae sp. FL0255]
MFARPRPKKVPLPPPKRRKTHHAIEEIKFDEDARTEYLTGFHKRKLQRVKNAQEQAAKRAREEKLELRKQIREDRKREVEEHVEHVHSLLKQAQQAGYISSEEDSENENAEAWGGFPDVPATGGEDLVDHEEEYIDEDRYTTVTVESVNVSREGLIRSRPDDDQGSDDEGEKDADEGKDQASKRDEKDGRMNKKKKRKFRYETKHERQITNLKQKARNKRRRG